MFGLIDISAPLAILVFALIIDAIFGEPEFLWRRMPHPVVAIGRTIDWADKRFNLEEEDMDQGQRKGLLLAIGLLIGGLAAGFLVQFVLHALPAGWLVLALLTSTLIAQRSLSEHVLSVANGLELSGLEGGRAAVSRIVGRDPQTLSEAGVSRAAIESCAENFSDGIVAPVFWFACLGFGGLLAYKAINTADSMIGHRNERYENFGKAVARLDDLVNLIPARIAGLLIALAAPLANRSPLSGIRTMFADARKHRSPNAGWPEAAMASATGTALAGPRVYGGTLTDDPYLNPAGNADATSLDIRIAVRLMIGACAIQALVILGLWLFP